MKYFSMFSGVGGFELGIQRAFDNQHQGRGDKVLQQEQPDTPSQPIQRTATCIGYSEIDKYAIETYEHNWKGHKNYGDATLINERELPDFNLLVGGFPCQAFSVAGKRAGFNDTRGTLFFDIARILKEKRPRHLVLENVKGLLSHDQGKTFQTILGVLTDLGYRVEWQVLNSKDFGVPQNRERVFIVGHLGNECGRKVFPITGASRQNVQPSSKEQGGRSWVSTLDSRYGERWSTETYVQLTETRTDEAKRVRRENMKQGKDWSPRRGKVLKPRPDKIGNTVTAGQSKEHYLSNGAKIRRLTPLECERLQGFPDDWTAGESDTQRYKMCGNAVTVNVVEAVIRGLYGYESS